MFTKMTFPIDVSKLACGVLYERSTDCACAIGQALIHLGVPKETMEGQGSPAGVISLLRLKHRDEEADNFIEQWQKLGIVCAAREEGMAYNMDWVHDTFRYSDRYANSVKYAMPEQDALVELVKAFKRGGHTVELKGVPQ